MAGGKQGLVSVENTVLIEKDEDGDVDFEDVDDVPGWQGMGRGMLVGGLMGLLFPGAVTAKPTAGTFGAQIQEAGFDTERIRQFASDMPLGSSAVVAVVRSDSADDLVAFLQGRAAEVVTVALIEPAAGALEAYGQAIGWRAP
jgi:uncharacterized membrane protein